MILLENNYSYRHVSPNCTIKLAKWESQKNINNKTSKNIDKSIHEDNIQHQLTSQYKQKEQGAV